MAKKEKREADYKIDHLIALMEKIVVPIPAILAVPPISKNDDHDLLLRLEENVNINFRQVKDAIKALSEGASGRIDKLEQDKLDIKYSYPILYKKGVEDCIADHETRIRLNTERIIKMMTYGTVLIFFIGIVEFIINKYY